MEDLLIKSICNTIKDPSFIGDDCAVINIKEQEFLLCLDNFVENTHFSSTYFSVSDIGYKSLAVNFSDIAAMSGEALYVLVGLSLNKNIVNKEQWVKEFYQGMQECIDEHSQAKIIGGDLSAQNSFTTVSVTVIGQAQKAIKRKLDDINPNKEYQVCVTGKFGNSKNFLDNPNKAFAQDKQYHLRPIPRFKEASQVKFGAMMDASDGLAASLLQLADLNQGLIEIESALIPKDEHISLEQALYGGEDYELVGIFSDCPQNFKKIGVFTQKDKKQGLYDNTNKIQIDKSLEFKHF